MGRRIRSDFAGPDWRRPPEALREQGLAASFGVAPQALPALVVDVGFGRGEFLLALAQQEPGRPHLGIEYSHKRVLKLARRIAPLDLDNLRLCEAEAERVLTECLPDASVERFWINFPDPWPKKRHHRRRLIQSDFVAQLVRCLAPGGQLDIGTDHPGYAEWIDERLRAVAGLRNLFAPQAWRPEVEGRRPTAYELEWRAAGRALHFFRYARLDTPAAGMPSGA